MARERRKEKVAISIDSALLRSLDSYADGVSVRNRSQAIEFLLRRAMAEYGVKTAVLLLKAGHVKVAMQDVEGKPLLKRQHEFLLRNGITRILVLTQKCPGATKLNSFAGQISPGIEVVVQSANGSAAALRGIRQRLLGESFVVMDGDTLMDFDLGKMIKRHMESNKVLTMGLIQSPIAERYTSVELDGDSVKEINRKKHGMSRVIDAGIYIMRPAVFDYIPANAKSLASDVLPRLVRENQVLGYFTFGQYAHLAE